MSGSRGPAAAVLLAVQRPTGYEDVHPQLVAEDAMRAGWEYEVLSDDGAAVVLAIERAEDYESSAAEEVAAEAVNPGWNWSVLRQEARAGSA